MCQAARLIFGFFFLTAFIAGSCVANSGVEGGRRPNPLPGSASVPFIRNAGQVANPAVEYYAKTFGGTVFILNDGAIVYSLPKFDSGAQAGSAVLTERFCGGFKAEPLGVEKSRAVVNSFIGNRPEQWRANLPAFDKLDFGEVYDGVSLLLSAHGNNVEKIFVVAPGADPCQIVFRYEGERGVEITDDGKLGLQTALGPVYFSRPVAWQIDETGLCGGCFVGSPLVGDRFPAFSGSACGGKDGHAQARPLHSSIIEVSYVLDEDGTVRFELGPYDRNKILIIDPLLSSTFIGGGGGDAIQAVAVDSQTNIYVAGYTDSSDFPVTNSPYCSTNIGQYDICVSKFDSNLGNLSASTYLGGASNDQAYAVAIDSASRIWVAGYTESANFPVPLSPLDASYNGNGDAFVAIMSSDLGALVQATYLGGSNVDCATAMAVDNSIRRQYIVGYTESGNFPVSSTAYQTNYGGARDAFAVVFSNAVGSSEFEAGSFLGGTGADEAAALAITPESMTNFVYIAGYTASGNFPVTNGCQMSLGGSNDAFISRLSVLLTNLSVSTFLGGTGSDAAYAVGLDISNRVYAAGYTRSGNFPQNPTNNVYLTGWTNAYQGGQDIFVACLTNNLTNLSASTYIGSTNDDVARGLLVDSDTNRTYVSLAGYTTSSNFPATRNAYDRYYNGGEDAFALRFDARLTNLSASTYLGGGGNDRALAMTFASGSNELVVAGITASSDFPASDAAYKNEFCGGASDGFVTRFAASLAYGTVKWQKSLYYSGSRCSSPALTWDGAVVLGNSTSLYAFTRSGAERWQAPTTSAVAIQIDPLEGLGVPAVGTNDVIYINTSSGKVHAITSAGAATELFQGVTPPSVRWSSIAFSGENRLFFGQGSKLYSLNVNGMRLWTNSLESDCLSSPAISSNGTIYAVASGSPAKLYAIDSAGITSNTWTTAGSSYSSPALETNGTIYTTSGNKLYAFLPDGTTARTWTAAGDILSSPSIGTNGIIYVGGGSNLYAFNAGGTTAKVWHTGNPVKSSPAIAADGSIIVGAAKPDTTGIIYSFNSDGTTNWVYETDYEIHYQSPLIDSEGTIYISDIFYIYALYGSEPPADSPWPMFRHDALRTGNQGMNASTFLRPTGLTVSKGAFTNYIHVGWNGNSNALNYELWRSLTNSSSTASRFKRLTQTNYNDASIDPGKIYYYWVKAKTPIALSAFSASDSGGVPPYPPTGVTASDGVPTNYVQLTWNVSTNASIYYIYRSLTDDTNTASYLDSSSATNYADYTVAPGLRHFYWVKAANAEAGESGFSASDGGGIQSLPPGGLSASQGAYLHLVTLSWNSSIGASSYLVYRNTDNNSAGATLISETGDQSLSDADVTPLRPYYYWVRATNEFGLSGFGSPACGWGLLASPRSVQASAGAYSNMIRISWVIGSTDATAHVIFRGTNSSSSSAARQSDVVYNSATATNYDDTAIIRGLSYYYWVAAKDNYGSSSWTAASSAGGTAPATPTDLDATDGVYSNMVKVTWNSAVGATYYTVYRNETIDSSSATVLGSTFTNFYDDRGAIMGVLYYYWVKAANDYGLSGVSTFNSGWRAMVPPDNITASDGVSTSKVSVTWSPAPNASSYELWRGTISNSAAASRLANNVAAISYDDYSANPGTVYYYWVKSKRGAYVSAFSGSDYGYRAIGLLDIAVSDLIFVPVSMGLLAHPSAVSFKVSNLSANDMVDPNNAVQYDFYLTRTPNFGEGEAYWFGGTNSTLSLTAGASTRVVFSQIMRQVISIPVWSSGAYYVFVFINHCLPSGWSDPDLANNVARRVGDSITVAPATARQPVWSDFDGDGKSDLAVYGEAAGAWRVWLSTLAYTAVDLTGLGGTGYYAVPRDYDCDGKFDPAVYQGAPSTGSGQGGGWRVCLSGSGYQTVLAAAWGGSGQTAVPADYDGDGKVDPAVYQAGTWRVWPSASGYAEVIVSGLGGTDWQPVAADYDGDGYTDPAVYQEFAGTWRIWLSANYYIESIATGWGASGQTAVPADYDGDGKVDPAVYESSPGTWRIWLSGDSYRENSVTAWGGVGQTAVPGDYDGDGKADPVVYWESMGIWRLWLSSYHYPEVDVLKSGGEGFHAITEEE